MVLFLEKCGNSNVSNMNKSIFFIISIKIIYYIVDYEDAVQYLMHLRNVKPPIYNIRRLKELPLPPLGNHDPDNLNWLRQLIDDHNDSNVSTSSASDHEENDGIDELNWSNSTQNDMSHEEDGPITENNEAPFDEASNLNADITTAPDNESTEDVFNSSTNSFTPSEQEANELNDVTTTAKTVIPAKTHEDLANEEPLIDQVNDEHEDAEIPDPLQITATESNDNDNFSVSTGVDTSCNNSLIDQPNTDRIATPTDSNDISNSAENDGSDINVSCNDSMIDEASGEREYAGNTDPLQFTTTESNGNGNDNGISSKNVSSSVDKSCNNSLIDQPNQEKNCAENNAPFPITTLTDSNDNDNDNSAEIAGSGAGVSCNDSMIDEVSGGHGYAENTDPIQIITAESSNGNGQNMKIESTLHLIEACSDAGELDAILDEDVEVDCGEDVVMIIGKCGVPQPLLTTDENMVKRENDVISGDLPFNQIVCIRTVILVFLPID